MKFGGTSVANIERINAVATPVLAGAFLRVVVNARLQQIEQRFLNLAEGQKLEVRRIATVVLPQDRLAEALSRRHFYAVAILLLSVESRFSMTAAGLLILSGLAISAARAAQEPEPVIQPGQQFARR